MLAIARELQHAACRAFDRAADPAQPVPVAQRVQVGCADQARGDVVVARDQRHEDAGMVARRFHRRALVALQQAYFPSARAQALACRSACKACADDDGAANRRRRRRKARLAAGERGMPHTALRLGFERETVRRQVRLLAFGQPTGFQPRVGGRKPRKRAPKGRIRRIDMMQAHEIDARRKLRQRHLKRRRQQVERHASLGLWNAMEPRHQPIGERDDVQVGRPFGIGAPRLHQLAHAAAVAVSRVEHRVALAAAPVRAHVHLSGRYGRSSRDRGRRPCRCPACTHR
jgi:hypothetical protein